MHLCWRNRILLSVISKAAPTNWVHSQFLAQHSNLSFVFSASFGYFWLPTWNALSTYKVQIPMNTEKIFQQYRGGSEVFFFLDCHWDDFGDFFPNIHQSLKILRAVSGTSKNYLQDSSLVEVPIIFFVKFYVALTVDLKYIFKENLKHMCKWHTNYYFCSFLQCRRYFWL